MKAIKFKEQIKILLILKNVKNKFKNMHYN